MKQILEQCSFYDGRGSAAWCMTAGASQGEAGLKFPCLTCSSASRLALSLHACKRKAQGPACAAMPQSILPFLSLPQVM